MEDFYDYEQAADIAWEFDPVITQAEQASKALRDAELTLERFLAADPEVRDAQGSQLQLAFEQWRGLHPELLTNQVTTIAEYLNTSIVPIIQPAIEHWCASHNYAASMAEDLEAMSPDWASLVDQIRASPGWTSVADQIRASPGWTSVVSGIRELAGQRLGDVALAAKAIAETGVVFMPEVRGTGQVVVPGGNAAPPERFATLACGKRLGLMVIALSVLLSLDLPPKARDELVYLITVISAAIWAGSKVIKS